MGTRQGTAPDEESRRKLTACGGLELSRALHSPEGRFLREAFAGAFPKDKVTADTVYRASRG